MVSSPTTNLMHQHVALLDLCDALEAVADSLPGPVPAERCAELAADIVERLEICQREEERVLLPLLAASPRPDIREVADRLRREHEFDSDAVMDVREALLAMAARRPLLSPDANGFLLRSFFESLRRHIRTEQALLALLADIPESRSKPH